MRCTLQTVQRIAKVRYDTCVNSLFIKEISRPHMDPVLLVDVIHYTPSLAALGPLMCSVMYSMATQLNLLYTISQKRV